MVEMKKLEEFQEYISYKFNDEQILFQALTTPQFANESGLEDYEVLETLGDAIIKLIFILKKYNEGIKSPGAITKLKQQLENDNTLNKIAIQYFKLDKFIFKSEKQEVEGTKILADIFEAICGAMFLDANMDIKIVEKKIIDKFYDDWDRIVEKSSILYKNMLLEFLQSRLRFTPIIETEFESIGPDNKPIWIAKNPKLYDPNKKKLRNLNKYIKYLKSEKFKTKKQAEQYLFFKMLEILKRNLKNI